MFLLCVTSSGLVIKLLCCLGCSIWWVYILCVLHFIKLELGDGSFSVSVISWLWWGGVIEVCVEGVLGGLFYADREYDIFLGLDYGILVMFLCCSFTTWGVFTFSEG